MYRPHMRVCLCEKASRSVSSISCFSKLHDFTSLTPDTFINTISKHTYYAIMRLAQHPPCPERDRHILTISNTSFVQYSNLRRPRLPLTPTVPRDNHVSFRHWAAGLKFQAFKTVEYQGLFRSSRGGTCQLVRLLYLLTIMINLNLEDFFRGSAPACLSMLLAIQSCRGIRMGFTRIGLLIDHTLLDSP